MSKEQAQVLNKDVMINLIGNEPETIKQFEVDFIKQAHQAMKTIITQYNTNNFAEIKETAHFLKTSAHAIGAEQTAALLEKLEEISASHDKEKCKEYIILINNAIKQVYKVIIDEN